MLVVFQPDYETGQINTDNAYFGLSCVFFIYNMVRDRNLLSPVTTRALALTICIPCSCP